MDTRTATTLNDRPPSDDALIGRALLQAEEKLAAWSAAMYAAQELLTRRLAGGVAPRSPAANGTCDAQVCERSGLAGARCPGPEPSSGDAPEPDADPRAVVGRSQRDLAETHPAGFESKPPPEDASTPADPPVCGVSGTPDEERADQRTDSTEELGGAPAAGSELAPMARSGEGQDGSLLPSSEEDEDLLATLEPEIAMAIRVKRRLTGNAKSKSVRELLAEIEQRRSSPAEKVPQRRRWWKT